MTPREIALKCAEICEERADGSAMKHVGTLSYEDAQCAAAIRAFADTLPSENGAMTERETRRVYRDATNNEYQTYLNARFDKSSGHNSFVWQGRRWRYEYSDFDEHGDFDLLIGAAPSPTVNDHEGAALASGSKG